MHKVMAIAALALTLVAQTLAAPSALAQTKVVPVLSGDWRLYRTGTVKRTVLVARVGAPTIRFEGNRVLGNAGCNSYFGNITQQGGSVSIGALASTKRACTSKVLGALETRYLRSLGQVQAVSISGPVLAMLTRDGQVLAFRQGK